jgi:hypothetical protein
MRDLKLIELNLTNYCNLKCKNCCSSCFLAPSSNFMSLEIIERFVEEAIELRWKFDRIKMYGGEPTLHPYFSEVVRLLNRYKEFNKNCKICLLTNGVGVSDKIKGVDEIWNSFGNKGKKFESYNLAPVDLPEYKDIDFAKGCFRIRECGISLSCDGYYYLCAPGLHVDRVFKIKIGVRTLKEITDDKIKDQANALCRYCGLFKFPRHYVEEQVISPSWQQAYLDYIKSMRVL